jgi:hypothetical protein
MGGGPPTYTGYALGSVTPAFIDPPAPTYGRLLNKKADQDPAKNRLKTWIKAEVQYNHPYRLKQWATWTKADYFDANVQWLEPFILGVGGSYRWSPLTFKKEEQGFPTPSFNEFSAPIENESSRLGRPEYQPYVRPTGERPDPKARRGARLSEQVLQSCLTDMRWVEEQTMGNLHLPLYGGWFIFSYWETDWTDTVRVPIPGSVGCPECGAMFTSAVVPADQFEAGFGGGHPGVQNVMPEELPQGHPPAIRMTNCPNCTTEEQTQVPRTWPSGAPMVDDSGQPINETQTNVKAGPELQPKAAIRDELHSFDPFGRPLGQETPKGQWRCRTLSPYDVFVRNLGVDEKPGALDEFTIVEVVPLDYVRNRWPNGYLVKAEQPAALMMFHPVAGERTIYQGTGAGGPGMFRSHVRLFRKYKRPWVEVPQDESGKPIPDVPGKLNKGRASIMAGDVILEDGDFLVESQNNKGVFIPKVHLDYVPWKIRAGGKEMHGMSMSENLFDPQEASNETISQYKDAMEREGSPKWLVERQLNFDYEASGEAGAQWTWDMIPDMPEIKPERVESTLMSQGVFGFLGYVKDHIARSTNLNEVEQGQVPQGISAALALQILAENSGERRRERIRRIREALERVYSHGLKLMHELVREDRLYWLKEDAGSWSQKSWSGLDLQGQTDVQINAEPEHHTPLQRQQRIKDMKDLFPELFQSPRAMRQLAKSMGYELEGFDALSLQDEAAQREMSRFMDEGRAPVIDQDLDNHGDHHDQHGEDFMAEQWSDLEDEAQWDQALPYIAQWQAYLQKMQGSPGSQFPEPPVPPSPPDPTWQKIQPPSLELQIFEVWRMMLARANEAKPQLKFLLLFDIRAADFDLMGYAKAPPLVKVLRMRAHDTAHKLMGQGQMAAAGAGAPAMAPAGGEKTAAGTVPAAPPPGSAAASVPAQ